MDNPPQSQQGNESPGYYVSMADASTQASDEDFILLEPIKEVSTQTTDEDFILLEPIKEASTQTIDEDFDSLMKPTQDASSQTIEDDFEFLTEIQSNANTSMATSEDRSESVIGHHNPVGSKNLSDLQFSSFLDSSTDFDMACGSKDPLVPSGTALTQNTKRESTGNNPSHKRSKSEICAKSGKDILTDDKQPDVHYGEVFESSATIQTEHDSDSDPIDNEFQSEISDSETPRFSVDDIPEAPGSPGIRKNENSRNFCRNILQSWYKSELPSDKFTDEGSLICKVCEKKIHEHLTTEKNLYQCCDCLYGTLKQGNLIMHSFSHRPKIICEICEKKYTEGELHISEHSCKACDEKFECRTKLEEHSLNHEEYFSIRCWVCSRNIDKHSSKQTGKKLYRCCGCVFDTFQLSNLTLHNKKHRPKLFCKICKEEYGFEDNGLHCKEYRCIVCETTFQCQSLLEDHYESHKEHFQSNCRICGVKMRKHKTEHESKIVYKCCRCEYTSERRSNLQCHLFTHTGLRMFTCDICGKRYIQSRSLIKHERKCRALLYKCEICGARYKTISELEMHHLGENREI